MLYFILRMTRPTKTYSSDTVTYSGPTYIGIRSKTSQIECVWLPCWYEANKRATGVQEKFRKLKEQRKIGYDSNCRWGTRWKTRYEKKFSRAVDYFNTYDLDVFFLVKNASGRSAFNRVERRKAPLNIELGGVLLEHEHFGVHLDDKGDTIDPYLELKKLGTCRKDFRWNLEQDDHPWQSSNIGKRLTIKHRRLPRM